MCGHEKAGRLLVITDDPAVRLGDKIFTSGTVNYFWLELSRRFGGTRLSMPVKEVLERNGFYPHVLNPDGGVAITERRFYHSKWDALANPVALILNAVSLFRDMLWADIILYRIPSALLPIMLPFLLILRRKKKVILYVGGDLYGRNTAASKRCGRRPFKDVMVFVYNFFEKRAASSLNTLANGEEMANKYSANLFDVSLIKSCMVLHGPKKFDTENIQLLFVGRLDANKGVDILLSAVALLDPDIRKRLRLVIVGSGPEEERLKIGAKALQLEGIVLFAGAVPFEKVERYFIESDIFVLPSYSETVTKVLYEAMAKGLAIVATEVGGVPYGTDGGMCARLVPPGSPECMKDALTEIINNNELRKKLVENGLRKVSDNTMEKKLTELERILKS